MKKPYKKYVKETCPVKIGINNEVYDQYLEILENFKIPHKLILGKDLYQNTDKIVNFYIQGFVVYIEWVEGKVVKLIGKIPE